MEGTRPLSRASSAALNARPGPPVRAVDRGTKRKRPEADEARADELVVIKVGSMPHFGAQPSVHTHHPKQQTAPARSDLHLLPRITVARSKLPLVYLDTATDLQHSYPRLFRGRIAALDAAAEKGKRQDARTDGWITVAEEETTSRLFAIECVRDDIYALCALQAWVSLPDLNRKPSKTRAVQAAGDHLATTDNWCPPAVVTKSVSNSATETSRAPLRSSFALKPTAQREGNGTPNFLGPAAAPSHQHPDAEETLGDIPEIDILDPADLLLAIRTNYLESLYIHRTPLAYFVKGPLSRARAGLKRKYPAPQRYDELAEYLKTHIMTVSIGNKKYKETVAELIREIPAGLTVDDVDGQITTPIKDRIRKSKKRKQMSKEGLIPGEEDYVVRWWVRRDAAIEHGGESDTRESRIQSSLTDQRARETQLQIILILEVLALQSATADDQLETGVQQDIGASPAMKKKKRQLDLSNILDVLIDRLCIWESMNLDAPQSIKNQEQEGGRKGSGVQKEPDSDRLRDFCTDIVVPYYAARLPELYLTICQKLGGPSFASSPPAMRTPAPTKSVKPGAAISRAALKEKKVDANASTILKRAHAPLARAATDSQLPSLKRELSQIDLASQPQRRPTLQESRRFSHREVDLGAIAQATEAKLQRKAAADRELKNAIAALRKPNPRAAMKEYVDSTEQHQAALKSAKSRKSKQPTRNPFATAIQVSATPKVNRQARVEPYALPPPPGPLYTASQPATVSFETIPPSSDPRIPSSSSKPAPTLQQPLPDLLADTPHRAFLEPPSHRYAGPDATPTRKRAKVVPARRPTISLSTIPEIVVPRSDRPRAGDGSSPPLPALRHTPRPAFRRPTISEAQEEANARVEEPPSDALLCTPMKVGRPAAFVADEEQHEASAETKVMPDEGEDEDGLVLIGDTPARPAPAAKAAVQARPGAAERDQPLSGVKTQATPEPDAPRAEGRAVAPREGASQPEADIYSLLGWDDDAEDLGF